MILENAISFFKQALQNVDQQLMCTKSNYIILLKSNPHVYYFPSS